jgi:hypothetical protein
MKTNRRNLVTLALVVTAVCCALRATEAHAQQVESYPFERVVYELHYDRVYTGTSWHWSPELGWHTHANYVDVPHWVPVRYTYWPSPIRYAESRPPREPYYLR